PKRLKALLPFLLLYQASGLKKLLNNLGLLPDSLAVAEGMLPEIKLSSLFSSLPAISPAKGKKRYRVAMLTGCVQSVLFTQTNEATVRVLVENGCEVVIPKNQGCCGALSVHSGRLSEGRDFARTNVDVFTKYDVDAVIVNSAGCGSSMKEYGQLLKDDPYYTEMAEKVGKNAKDVMEFLSEIGLQGQLKELKLRVTYQDACHIVHAQRIKDPPRSIIKQIPGIEFVELPESDLCCGSAGIYNMVQPEMSQGLLERKLSKLMETRVDYLVAGNPGCLLQIQKGINKKGLKVKTAHPVELLDWSYRGMSPK
ncbi:MAG: (Fe-S)-binding protein, partial [Thermodesulfobacteriota bacterium]